MSKPLKGLLCFSPPTRGNSKLEHKFSEQLERVLGTSAPSALPEVTYDVEEVMDEEESQDGEDDLQIMHSTNHSTNHREVGTLETFLMIFSF